MENTNTGTGKKGEGKTMRTENGIRIGWIVAFVALAGILPAGATTKTWNGSVSTNWADASNWTGGLPDTGDDVVITNTTAKPYMLSGAYPASGAFASFSISNGATVTCLGDTNSVNGGTVTVPYGTGVAIHCQSGVIAGTLTAAGKGFPVKSGPGYVNYGGSHGGRGGGAAGGTYGSLQQPSSLGSGGIGSGCAGGGAIRLLVDGTLEVSGTINVDGLGTSWGGAGGSVWIMANTLTGAGAIYARGGTRGGNPSEGGGGGGRVAIDYTSSSFTGTVSVAGGGGADRNSYSPSDGQPGTLWEPRRFDNVLGTAANPTNVVVNQSFQYYFTNTVMRYWQLTVTNSAWFEVHNGSMALSGLTLSKGKFNFDTFAADGRHGNPDMASMSITGNVYMSNDSTPFSQLWLPAGDYTFNALSIGTGSVLYACGNTNSVNGGTAGVPYGTGVLIHCQSAAIAGTLSADAMGFPSKGPGYSGSYGGLSGYSPGSPYGSLTQPNALGSGSLYGDGGTGGGAIRLLVDGVLQVDTNGLISAGGATPSERIDGGSNGGTSGGSVWITAGTIAGGGKIRALGYHRTSNPSQAGGGGGRVAIEYSTSSFTGTVSAAGGYGGTGYNNDGKAGTYFNCRWTYQGAVPPFGNGVTLSNRYVTVIGSSTNSSTNGLMILRVVDQWNGTTPRLRWTETSTDPASNQQDSVVTYNVRGLSAGLPLRVYDNQNLVCVTNSGAGGTLGFTVTLNTGAHVIDIRSTGGTAIWMR